MRNIKIIFYVLLIMFMSSHNSICFSNPQIDGFISRYNQDAASENRSDIYITKKIYSNADNHYYLIIGNSSNNNFYIKVNQDLTSLQCLFDNQYYFTEVARYIYSGIGVEKISGIKALNYLMDNMTTTITGGIGDSPVYSQLTNSSYMSTLIVDYGINNGYKQKWLFTIKR